MKEARERVLREQQANQFINEFQFTSSDATPPHDNDSPNPPSEVLSTSPGPLSNLPATDSATTEDSHSPITSYPLQTPSLSPSADSSSLLSAAPINKPVETTRISRLSELQKRKEAILREINSPIQLSSSMELASTSNDAFHSSDTITRHADSNTDPQSLYHRSPSAPQLTSLSIPAPSPSPPSPASKSPSSASLVDSGNSLTSSVSSNTISTSPLHSSVDSTTCFPPPSPSFSSKDEDLTSSTDTEAASLLSSLPVTPVIDFGEFLTSPSVDSAPAESHTTIQAIPHAADAPSTQPPLQTAQEALNNEQEEKKTEEIEDNSGKKERNVDIDFDLDHLLKKASALIKKPEKKAISTEKVEEETRIQAKEEKKEDEELKEVLNSLKNSSFVNNYDLENLVNEKEKIIIQSTEENKQKILNSEKIQTVRGDGINYFLLTVAADKTPLAAPAIRENKVHIISPIYQLSSSPSSSNPSTHPPPSLPSNPNPSHRPTASIAKNVNLVCNKNGNLTLSLAPPDLPV